MKPLKKKKLSNENQERESTRLAAFVLGAKKWMRERRKALLLVWMGFVLVGLVIGLVIGFGKNGTLDLGDGGSEEEVTATHPLTGLPVEEAYTVLPRVFAVMVENAADAWPLSGVEDAFLVIEAPVEGNIPRFVAFFSEEDTVEKIGPVRSARPYYLDWASAFRAIYAHVGGSPEALALIPKRMIQDLNQFYQSEYFWRQTTGGRYAPHNVYTSIDLLKEAAVEFPKEEGEVYEGMRFGELTGEFEAATSIEVDFGPGSTYDVQWEYQDGVYTRYQNGSIMKMTDGDTIGVNNVVVLTMDVQTVDNEGRKSIETVGFGSGVMYRDGKQIPITWRKTAESYQLELVNDAGEFVPLAPGTTWIQVLGG